MMPDRTLRRGLRFLGYFLLGLFGLSFVSWGGMKLFTAFSLRAVKAAVAHAPARPPLPSPNAYEDYAAAVQLLRGGDEIGRLTSRRPDPLPASLPPEREALLRRNAPALARLRRGFAHDYRQPPPPPSLGPSEREVKKEGALFTHFRTLARLLALEGQVKAARGDQSGAVRSYLDAIRLGEDLPRGGAMIQAMMGHTTASIGRRRLCDAVDRLDSDTARSAARRLEALSERHVPYREILAEERERKRDGIRDALEYPDRYPPEDMAASHLTREESRSYRENMPLINYHALRADDAYLRAFRSHGDRPVFSKSPKDYALTGRMASTFLEMFSPTYDTGWVRERDDLTQNRLLAAELALRAYRGEHGSHPASLTALVPADLTAVPEDPFAPGKALKYRRQGGRYLLYSVGPDGVDDDGKPIDRPRSGKRNKKSRDRFNVEADSKGDVVAGINP